MEPADSLRPQKYRDIIPSMKRRMLNHDYSKPGFYFITMNINDHTPRLSVVVGRPYKINTTEIIPETDEAFAPRVEFSPIGKIVSKELYALSDRFPVIIRNSVLMPDHIHFIIEVLETLPRKLGSVMSSFMGRCSSILWASAPESAIARDRLSFWKKGYTDKIVYSKGQLPRFVHYVKENPRKYLIRKEHPAYFYDRWEFTALGQRWHAIGNIFLLSHPIRENIRFSRRLSTEEWESRKETWRYVSTQQDVVVSTFIHPEEKRITKECTNLGAKLIWIKCDGFPDRSAVKGELAYSLCAAGRLLMIAPEKHHTSAQALTRSQCMQLNDLAAYICQNDIIPSPLR